MSAAEDQRIRGLRVPKPRIDPWKAHGVHVDDERRSGGRMEKAFTIFLAGSECPFTCSFCDLWRWSIDGPTPAGAIPKQIEQALSSAADGASGVSRLKLYNASNFFDVRAVPRADLPRIAELCAPFDAVTVESHANMVGAPALEFASRLRGRLEVAIGLETIHTEAAMRLNKRLALEQFDRAAGLLGANGIDIRAFVLLGAPHVPPDESVEWTVRSAAYAAERGASAVSVIPVRGGNGELERLQSLGQFTPPTLVQLEETLEELLPEGGARRADGPWRMAERGWRMADGGWRMADGGERRAENGERIAERTAFAADLWDAALLPACEECRVARVDRVRRMNLTGERQPPVVCGACAT